MVGMKKLFLITSLLFCSVSFGQETNIEFTINCEIVDSLVLEMKDGKPQRYIGYEAEYEKFLVDNSISGYAISIDIPSEKRYMGFYGAFNEDFKSSNTNPEEGIDVKDMQSEFGQRFFEFDNPIFKEAIFASNAIHIPQTGISLERYYKNDWQLSFIGIELASTENMLGNCMGVSSEYNEILDVMESFEKQEYK